MKTPPASCCCSSATIIQMAIVRKELRLVQCPVLRNSEGSTEKHVHDRVDADRAAQRFQRQPSEGQIQRHFASLRPSRKHRLSLIFFRISPGSCAQIPDTPTGSVGARLQKPWPTGCRGGSGWAAAASAAASTVFGASIFRRRSNRSATPSPSAAWSPKPEGLSIETGRQCAAATENRGGLGMGGSRS